MDICGCAAAVDTPGRLAVVTGASSGLGAEFARQLAGQGYGLLLVARRRERLQELATTLSANHGIAAEALAVDLGARAELEALAARLANEPVELLVNNAGFGITGRFFDMDVAVWERMVRVHVDAALLLTHAVLPGMMARDRGAVVSVSSLAAFAAMPGNVVYGATKSFLHSFTRSLDLELASRSSRVRVQVLCPGFTRTEFHAGMQDETAHIPGWAWMPAVEVVAASLRALEHNQVVVVPGWRNRLIVELLDAIPARVRRRLGMWLARRAKWPE
ncbi:MAG: SDR family oxidoreductase [Thermodesulfobacteriota bacterium]